MRKISLVILACVLALLALPASGMAQSNSGLDAYQEDPPGNSGGGGGGGGGGETDDGSSGSGGSTGSVSGSSGGFSSGAGSTYPPVGGSSSGFTPSGGGSGFGSGGSGSGSGGGGFAGSGGGGFAGSGGGGFDTSPPSTESVGAPGGLAGAIGAAALGDLTDPENTTFEPASSTDSGGGVELWLILALAVLGVGVLAALYVRRVRSRPQQPGVA